jgi:nuclear pore complex protein Nup155
MSIFETPLSQRQFQPSVYAAPATNTLYPEVPTDLRTPARTSNTYGGPPGASAGFVTPERPADVAKHPQQQQQLQKVPPTADNLSPVARAARTVNEYLTTEARYPQLDDIVSRKFSLLVRCFGRAM